MAAKQKKKGKTLLVIGLILLFLALFIGAGFLITGSIVFARNAIALALLGGAGVGVAVPVVKGISRLINGGGNKSNSQSRTIERDRELERTQDMEMEQLPEIKEEKDQEINVDLNKKAENTPSKTNKRK